MAEKINKSIDGNINFNDSSVLEIIKNKKTNNITIVGNWRALDILYGALRDISHHHETQAKIRIFNINGKEYNIKIQKYKIESAFLNIISANSV